MGSLGWRVTTVECGYPLPRELALTPAEEKAVAELCDRHLQEGGGTTLEKRLVAYCHEKRLLIEKTRADAMLQVAKAEVEGFGPFDFFLQDEELEEVAATGEGKPVFAYHRTRGWLDSNCVIDNCECAVNIINKMARQLGRRVTTQNPRINAVLPDSTRLHASIAPIAREGFEITLRKFRTKPFSVCELASNGTISTMAAAFLWASMAGDCNAIIAGNTGSGKTTTLNALFSFIPLEERILVVEETPEIKLPHPHIVRLVSAQELGVKLADLVKDSLRMRPDRVIVGEVRDAEEAQALFESLLAGQAHGVFATMHANTASEACARLRRMGAGPDELNAINIIVVQRRSFQFDADGNRTERRQVTEIACVKNGQATRLFAVKEGLLQPTPALTEYFKATKSGHKDLPLAVSNRQAALEKLCEKARSKPA
ncbi:MAG: ATPase, T2SS/T4P/T4SS family, partial [Candidatus Micrarchaeota archaeon]